MPAAATSASPEAGALDPCAEIRERFNATLAKRMDVCAASSDCACYGAVGGGCGGVTDAKTAKLLEPIEAEFHAAHCRYLVQCSPWACAPKCTGGACSR